LNSFSIQWELCNLCLIPLAVMLAATVKHIADPEKRIHDDKLVPEWKLVPEGKQTTLFFSVDMRMQEMMRDETNSNYCTDPNGVHQKFKRFQGQVMCLLECR
jgi:hypothetical protein